MSQEPTDFVVRCEQEDASEEPVDVKDVKLIDIKPEVMSPSTSHNESHHDMIDAKEEIDVKPSKAELRQKLFLEKLKESSPGDPSLQKDLYKMTFDTHYVLLRALRQRRTFDEYARERARAERVQRTQNRWNNNRRDSLDAGRFDASIEAEIKLNDIRSLGTTEEQREQFRQMLSDIGANSTFEIELPKMVYDPRYLLLNAHERQDVFNEYVNNQNNLAKEDYFNLLKEAEPGDDFEKFSNEYGSDPRFIGIDSDQKRKHYFMDFTTASSFNNFSLG